jgi:hypothetical protein
VVRNTLAHERPGRRTTSLLRGNLPAPAAPLGDVMAIVYTSRSLSEWREGVQRFVADNPLSCSRIAFKNNLVRPEKELPDGLGAG